MAIPDTVVRFKVEGTRVDTTAVAKKKGAAQKNPLGPATIAKPALMGAAALFVIQLAMRVFLKA